MENLTSSKRVSRSASPFLNNLPFAAAPGDLFYSSIAITNPLGLSYHGDNIEYAHGSTSPWDVTVYAYDWQRSTMLTIGTGDYLGNTHSRPGIIFEDNFDGSALWGEKGYWSLMQIPETSSVSLFVLGVFVLVLRRKSPPLDGHRKIDCVEVQQLTIRYPSAFSGSEIRTTLAAPLAGGTISSRP
jgi:hypothetical protein